VAGGGGSGDSSNSSSGGLSSQAAVRSMKWAPCWVPLSSFVAAARVLSSSTALCALGSLHAVSACGA
jgi:hypothetical protein